MSSREEKSRLLLSDILPRKGETSYDQFVTIVRETEGQKHVVKVLGGERRSLAAEKKELEKKLSESEKKNAKSELTNIGLRNKIGRWDGGHLKWKQFESNMSINCLPNGCVAEINGMIHVGWYNRMFQLKEGAWKGEKHHLGKGYVMEGGGFIGGNAREFMNGKVKQEIWNY
ncbi:uncharacterized protein [Oscarella lobularis]|uniref:uncharacterized protein n=1 Tax=Oscarella lobularis TaxID=121494 RepID=UPI0033131E06